MSLNWKAMICDGNGDPSWVEITAIGGTLLGFVMSVHSYFVRGNAFDPQAFGLGLASLIAAIGAAQRLRGDVDRDKANAEKA